VVVPARALHRGDFRFGSSLFRLGISSEARAAISSQHGRSARRAVPPTSRDYCVTEAAIRGTHCRSPFRIVSRIAPRSSRDSGMCGMGTG